MKIKLTIILIAFLSFNLNAQNEPTQATVLKDAKSPRALGDINYTAQKKYTWDQIKLQYKEFANGDNLYDPVFRTMRSTVAENLDLSYHDLGYYYLVATTPKDADGVYYDISLRILYYRSSQNGAWSFKESTMESNGFYRRGTEKIDNKATAQALEIMNSYAGDATKNSQVEYTILNESNHCDMIKINGISKNKNLPDEVLSAQRYTNFIVNGTIVICNAPTQAEILNYYENANVALQIYEEKDDNGKWKLVRVNMSPNNFGGTQITVKEEEQLSLTRYKTLRLHGFKEVFQKQGTYERSLFNKVDLERNEPKIKALFELFKADIAKGKEAITKMVNPTLANKDEIINSYVLFFEKAKAYECEITIRNPSFNAMNGGEFKNENLTYKFYSGINVKRKSCSGDKALEKKYKAAGMSKETLKGNTNLNERAKEIFMTFTNGGWYISSPMELDSNKKWD
jgi:hypothetical protein